MYKSIFTKRH